MKPYIIGLTGGIASGKTATAAVFERLGAVIVDADVISRKVVEPGTEGCERLKSVFSAAFDGDTLNRRALRETVFKSAELRKRLDEIMLPLIKAGIEESISRIGDGEVAVLVAPLLFESGLNSLADITVTVSAGSDIRLQRLLSRDNVSADIAAAMIASQLTDAEREERSDVVIRNDGDIKELRGKAAAVYNEIVERIKFPRSQ